MRPQPFFDLEKMDLDFDNPLFDIHEIRRINPQRHEMEQLTAVVYVDRETHSAIGYKDVTEKEFWSEGHMPGFPLMPGVIMCECAAQLAAFYARKYDLLGGDFLGFGGLDDVRFRKPVIPPCRLVLMARMQRMRKHRAEFAFQGYVDGQLVFHGTMIGVPINRGQEID